MNNPELDNLVARHQCICDTKKVDISVATEGTKPIPDTFIDEVPLYITVKSPTPVENLPNKIIFMIPNFQLPMEASMKSEELRVEQAQYVHLDNMPKELQQVVKHYLFLSTSSVNDLKLFIPLFKRSVNELNDKVQLMVVPPKEV